MNAIKSVAERIAGRQLRAAALADIEAAVRSAGTLAALRQEVLRLIALLKEK